MTAPNETSHAYGFDTLGRPTQDLVTAFGSGIDQKVTRTLAEMEGREAISSDDVMEAIQHRSLVRRLGA